MSSSGYDELLNIGKHRSVGSMLSSHHIEGRQLLDGEKLEYQFVKSLLDRAVEVAGEASKEGVVDGLDHWILQVDRLPHHLESPAEVSQANVASLGQFLDL